MRYNIKICPMCHQTVSLFEFEFLLILLLSNVLGLVSSIFFLWMSFYIDLATRLKNNLLIIKKYGCGPRQNVLDVFEHYLKRS